MSGIQEKIGAGKKYCILTYGCQMNVRDSEIIGGILEDMGYMEGILAEADLVVFNTCSVRHSAENKVYGKLGEIIKRKRNEPGLMIAFGGCMAQLPNVVERLKRQRVDVIFGTHNIHELPELIRESMHKKKKVINVWKEHGEVIENLPSVRSKGVSAYTNIMYGCNNFCSYCIVPYTRGRERSRKPDDIIKELNELAAAGYKEVTLLGQNVDSYGKGLDEKVEFSDLLQMANKVEGLERIRFTTSHPKDVSDRLIDTVSSCSKCCEHIHVAMQSGSNRILQRMNRKYSREYYLELVEKMRERIPGVSVTTDIIVGFPGETEEDFEDTLDMIKQIRFDAAFTFMYSVRSGTSAALFDEQVDLSDKKERLLRLNKIQYQIAEEMNKSLEGSSQEILVEGYSKTNNDMLTGRTRNNKIVIFSGSEDLIAKIINVKITQGKTFSIFGKL